MSNYINNISHTHTIDIAKKYGLTDTGVSVTYIRLESPHENAHKQGQTIYFLSA